MIKWEYLGKYLDRSVAIGQFKSLQDFANNTQLAQSIVMLCFIDRNLRKSEIEDFFKNIFVLSPLAIQIVGENPEINFSLLLKTQSLHQYAKHTMTAVTHEKSVNEWISDFFWTIWPSEERFDDWKEYRIIVIGEQALYMTISQKIQSFLQKSVSGHKA